LIVDILLIAGLWLDRSAWDEFTAAQAKQWIDAGDVPELAKARHLDVVDIDSGHWPMTTKPDGLARLLAAAAAGS
jgi:hypothetical protein